MPSFSMRHKRFVTHVVPQLIRLPPQGQTPTSPRFKSQWGLNSQVPQDNSKESSSYSTGTQALAVAISSRFHAEQTGKNVHLPVIPWMWLAACYLTCCLRFWILISLYVGAELGSSWEPERADGHTSCYFTSFTPTIKPSGQLFPGSSLSTHAAPQLLWLPLRN